MVEHDMFSAIVQWLNRSDYYATCECMIGGYCDVVGCKWAERFSRKPPELLEMVCVELKMRDIGGVISQAKGNHYHCNLSFCAMPADFCSRIKGDRLQKFIDAGVGLLSVSGAKVEILLNSIYKNRVPHEVFRKRQWAFKLRKERQNENT